MTNSKQKGARGEREFAKFLKERGFEARRGQQYSGSPDSPDVVCEALRDIHIEVKRVEALRLYEALEQAKSDASKTQTPVVFHRKNNKQWVAILDADAFLQLLSSVYEASSETPHA